MNINWEKIFETFCKYYDINNVLNNINKLRLIQWVYESYENMINNM